MTKTQTTSTKDIFCALRSFSDGFQDLPNGILAANYYYADGAGMIAGGITDPGAYAELTEVTSTSDFTAFQAMLCRFNLNPKVPA